MTKKGVFIIIEGLDGSGKTTQANLLAKKLSESFSVFFTAEPSHGKTGTYIRESCLYEEKRLPAASEALLFAADRIEHLENEVKPALAEGKVVICDRYLYSSLAYQGSAGLGTSWIKKINSYALKPDFGIFIDVPPEQVLERLRRRKKSVMETLEIQQKVRGIYLKFVENGELIKVDGNGPKDEVSSVLYSKILGFLEK